MKNLFSPGGDLSEKKVSLPSPYGEASLLWLDGCTDARSLSELIVRPLGELSVREDPAKEALRGGLWPGEARLSGDPEEIASLLPLGWCAVFFPGGEKALVLEVKSAAVRSIQAPTVEKSILGPKDAFVETLRMNTSRIRRRLPTPRLKLEELTLGDTAPGTVALIYIDGLAPALQVDALRRRLEALSIPSLTEPGAVERALCAAPRSVFPQVLHTERPDVFCAALLRGQTGVLCDGLPVGYLAPVKLPMLLGVGEDAARHAWVARCLGALRVLGLLLSLLLPALYTAAALYHPEMIPYTLLRSLIRAKEAVPFSTAAEVLGMLLSFELLQEAGIRLPEPVGQTVSVIGALIVGQSAVEAKVLSPIVIIVVALAGIGGYAQPSQELSSAVRLWRAVLVVLAAALGLFGVMAGLMELLRQLCDTENLGLAYLSPLVDRAGKGHKEAK